MRPFQTAASGWTGAGGASLRDAGGGGVDEISGGNPKKQPGAHDDAALCPERQSDAAGSEHAAEPGADGEPALEGKERDAAEPAGQDEHRHGRTAAAQLGGAAFAGTGGDQRAAGRRGSAGTIPHDWHFPGGGAGRRLRHGTAAEQGFLPEPERPGLSGPLRQLQADSGHPGVGRFAPGSRGSLLCFRHGPGRRFRSQCVRGFSADGGRRICSECVRGASADPPGAGPDGGSDGFAGGGNPSGRADTDHRRRDHPGRIQPDAGRIPGGAEARTAVDSGHGDAGAGSNRDPKPADPVQQSFRLLHRDHEELPQPGAGTVYPEADADERGTVHDAGTEGS